MAIKNGTQINIAKLSNKSLKTLFCELKQYGRWWFDILDCRWSMRRQKLCVSFEEGIQMVDYLKIIPTAFYRILDTPQDCLELGFHTFSTKEDVSYYFWLEIPIEHSSLAETLITDLS
jgi:hypothetical protein